METKARRLCVALSGAAMCVIAASVDAASSAKTILDQVNGPCATRSILADGCGETNMPTGDILKMWQAPGSRAAIYNDALQTSQPRKAGDSLELMGSELDVTKTTHSLDSLLASLHAENIRRSGPANEIATAPGLGQYQAAIKEDGRLLHGSKEAIATVPLPPAVILFGAGIVGLAVVARRGTGGANANEAGTVA